MCSYITYRKAFRDAVAEAGTLPALVTIADWIRSNKIEGEEAAGVVGALPRTALTPTPEYLNALSVSIQNVLKHNKCSTMADSPQHNNKHLASVNVYLLKKYSARMS